MSKSTSLHRRQTEEPRALGGLRGEPNGQAVMLALASKVALARPSSGPNDPDGFVDAVQLFKADVPVPAVAPRLPRWLSDPGVPADASGGPIYD